MTRRHRASARTNPDWERTEYTGHNVFPDAKTTEFVFQKGRLYSITIRFAELPEDPQARFRALREALAKKFGEFTQVSPAESKPVSSLIEDRAKQFGMHIEVARVGRGTTEIRVCHRKMKDRIAEEQQHPPPRDDLIDLYKF